MKPICPILHEWADGLHTEAEVMSHIKNCSDCLAIVKNIRSAVKLVLERELKELENEEEAF